MFADEVIDMQIVNQLDAAQTMELQRLYQSEWWSQGRTLEDTIRCVNGSSIIFGFIEQSQLIAFARVVTDYVFKAFIFDVIVAESARGKRLGERMVETIQAHPALQRVKHIELYCRPDMVPFYQRYGFTTDVGNMILMRHTTC